MKKCVSISLSLILVFIMLLSIQTSLHATDDGMSENYSSGTQQDILPLSTKTSISSSGWVLAPGKKIYGQSIYDLRVGDSVVFEINCDVWPSGGGMYLGLYNRDTESYEYMTKFSNSSQKTITVTTKGNYSIAFENRSSNDTVTVTGSFQVFNVGANPNFTISINVPLYQQEDSDWCWAACIQMSAEAIDSKYKKTQQNIVTTAKAASGTTGQTGGDKDYKYGMEYATDNVYTATRGASLTKTTLMTELSKGLPVIIGFKTSSKTAHANVLTAITSAGSYIRTNDPANGGSIKIYKFDDISDSNSYRYYTTTTIITKK